jgi:MFS family permease
MALFVAWELRVAEPMVPMAFFRNRAFSASNLSMLMLYASLLSTVFFLAQYFQASLGYGPLAAGLRFLPWTTTLFVVAPLAGSLADRIGARPLIVLGLAMQGAGFCWVAANVAGDRSYLASIPALVVAGVGTSMAMPAGQQAVMGAIPSAIGKASGVFNTLRQLGAVFGVAALAAVFAARGGYGTPQTFADGVAPALALSGALAILGAAFGLAIPGARPVRAVPAAAPTPVPVPSAQPQPQPQPEGEPTRA